jgi:hypothetical protein
MGDFRNNFDDSSDDWGGSGSQSGSDNSELSGM